MLSVFAATIAAFHILSWSTPITTSLNRSCSFHHGCSAKKDVL